MSDTVDSLGEAGLIALFADPSPASLLVENGDDAAVVPPSRLAQVYTSDDLVEGVHFDLLYTPAHSLGQKLVAVNLSDLAAMGASPRFLLLNVLVPGSFKVALLESIADSIRSYASIFNTKVIGGNVSRSPGPLVLSATAIGEVEPTQVVERRGASPGEGLFVTGSLGGAAGALARAKLLGPDGVSLDALHQRLVMPEPRVVAGRILGGRSLASAMCDVSDGLATDASQLAEASGVELLIQTDLVPVDANLRTVMSDEEALRTAVSGGEDYELLFCSGAAESELREACSPLAVTKIGEVRRGRGMRFSPELDASPIGHHFH